MMPTLDIYCGDAAHKLVNVGTESVELVLTSPPYDNARTYGGTKTPEWEFEAIARELYRVLVPGGVLCWNVNDMVVNGSETLTSCKQKIFFVEQCGFRIHDTMIWRKNNFANPESARYHQVFEYIFVLCKGEKLRAWNPIKDKPNTQAGRIGAFGTNTYSQRDGSKSTRHTYVTAEVGMRHNVWDGNTRGQEEFCTEKKHPAMMPKWLARDLILSFSNPGDTVLDPMAGSFTTCAAALELGRKAVGIELNRDYVKLGRETCHNITAGFQLA